MSWSIAFVSINAQKFFGFCFLVLTCLVIQFLLSFQISTPLLIGNLQYYFHFHHYYYHYSYHHYYYWYANDKTNLIGSQRPLLLTLRLELYSDRYPIKDVATCMEMFKILRGSRGLEGERGMTFLRFGRTHENARFFPVWLHPQQFNPVKRRLCFQSNLWYHYIHWAKGPLCSEEKM